MERTSLGLYAVGARFLELLEHFDAVEMLRDFPNGVVEAGATQGQFGEREQNHLTVALDLNGVAPVRVRVLDGKPHQRKPDVRQDNANDEPTVRGLVLDCPAFYERAKVLRA